MSNWKISGNDDDDDDDEMMLIKASHWSTFQWCRQDQIRKTEIKTKTAAYQTETKTKITGSKQRHLADLTFKYVNATVDLHSSDVPSTE